MNFILLLFRYILTYKFLFVFRAFYSLGMMHVCVMRDASALNKHSAEWFQCKVMSPLSTQTTFTKSGLLRYKINFHDTARSKPYTRLQIAIDYPTAIKRKLLKTKTWVDLPVNCIPYTMTPSRHIKVIATIICLYQEILTFIIRNI